MSRMFDVAVVGADQPVGQALMEMVRTGDFPLGRLYGVAGAADREDEGGEVFEALEEFDFGRVQIAFFAAPAAVARDFAPQAADAGCVAIDLSGAFGDEPDVPLVVAALDTAALADYRERMLVACPSPATVQLLAALQALHGAVGLERVNVTVLEPASAGGQAAVQELARQTAELLNARAISPRHYPRQIAFNVLPDTVDTDAHGHSGAERTLAREVQRLLGLAAPAVNATVAYVPVFFGAVQVLHIETRTEITVERARNLLNTQPGVKVLDDAHQDDANPVEIAAGEGAEVCIGRIREDSSHPRGLDLWVVADNVRRVAAANALAVARALAAEYM